MENLIHDLLHIIDLAYRRNCKGPMVGTHQKRLGFIIGNTPNPKIPFHLVHILIKLCTKGCIFNIVNCPVKALFLAVNRHTGPSCPQVGMIIRAEEQIKHTILF